MKKQKIGQQLFDASSLLPKKIITIAFIGKLWTRNEPAINFYKKNGSTFDGEWLNANLNC